LLLRIAAGEGAAGEFGACGQEVGGAARVCQGVQGHAGGDEPLLQACGGGGGVDGDEDGDDQSVGGGEEGVRRGTGGRGDRETNRRQYGGGNAAGFVCLFSCYRRF